MIRRGAGVVALVALVAACATKDPTNPGTPIGTFNVTGTLTKDTCGGAPNPWTFTTKLNADGATLYWLTGSIPISGEVDTKGSTTMTSSFTDEVRAATNSLAACDMTRTDNVKLLLSDASSQTASDASKAASFLGTLSYAFAATSDSSCTDQLSSAGNGGFDSIPCEVDYTITGSLAAATTTN